MSELTQGSPPAENQIIITPEAVAEVKRLLESHDLPDTAGIRIGVKGGGCSGFTYTLNFDYKSAEGDEVLEQDGVKLFCDPKSLIYLRGTRLTWTDGLQGKGFQFENPNASSTCGCGDSFSV
ncbi:MAG: iron-sulfur cluster assembly accessory protein [Planctomycetes bacterium]|nr:iron-sulfur cluster assembly accessory protein [Planctomycetota bacterium]